MTVQGKSAIDTLLAESFKELAMQRSIEKITIKEITDKAGVIRPTFYNHFQDKYELLEWIITNDLLWPIQPLVENRMIKEALTLLFTNIEKERDFYRQAVKLEGQNSFESIAEQSVTGVLLDIILKSPGGGAAKFSWLTPERIATYYAKDMCYVVISWIKSGFVISSKELVEIYQYIMRRSMDDVLFGE
ncbi:TetR/AcrR family transcriptional regulator C-terminal domain-containing protein [Lachnospiraceae bacterium 38-14]